MVKYSIIIPCYNSEKYIGFCLDALFRLSFDKTLFEVICIDDCSSDNTVGIVDEYIKKSDVNIRIIKNDLNSGPCLSRRKAAEDANGDYLLFCDSDDYYEPNVLDEVDKEIEKSKSELVFFDMSYDMGYKKHRKNSTALFKYGDQLSYLSNNVGSLCTLVVKRSLFLTVPIIDIRNGEDLALVPLLIMKTNNITHLKKSYYNYVMRSNSASLGKVSKNAYNNMLLAFDHIRQHLNTKDDSIKICVEYLGIKTVLYNSTLMAIKGGNDNKLLSKIVSDFSLDYPTWYNNALKAKLGNTKNLYLWALKNDVFILCRIFVKLHSYILTRK